MKKRFSSVLLNFIIKKENTFNRQKYSIKCFIMSLNLKYLPAFKK